MAQIDSEQQRSELFITVLILTLTLGLVGGTLILISSEWILVHFNLIKAASRQEVLGCIVWLPLALSLLLLNSAMIGSLQARERFGAINFATVLGDSLAQLLPLFVAQLGYVSIDILLPTVLSSRLLTTVFLFVQCIKHVPITKKIKIDLLYVKPLLGYGGWASAISMIGPLMTALDRLVIGTLSDAKGVTLFTIPFNLISKVSIIPNSLGAVLFPRLAALSSDESKALADKTGRSLIAFMSPVIIIVMGGIHPFMIFWLGHDLAERCAGIGELILLGVWINSAVMPYTYYLFAEARYKSKILVICLLEVPLYFLLLWFGVKNFGPLGAAGAWSLRVLLEALCFLILANAFRYMLFALSSVFFVIMSVAIVFYFDVTVVWRWLGIVSLLALSIGLHWKLCIDMLSLLFKRRLIM
jgi:O-antigen/teichoic acid export membrane protein